VKETDAPYTSSIGLRIHRRVFTPGSRDSVGVLVLVHGLGEHTGRYTSIIEALSDGCGLLCAGVDLPGHGDSVGKRGHIAALTDVHTLVSETRDFLLSQIPSHGDLVFTAIFGHSMGGLLTLDYLHHHPGKFTHAWISAPPLAPEHNRSRLILSFARKLDCLWPTYTLHNGLRRTDCYDETDPEFIKQHTRNCHRRISARLGVLLLDAADRLNSSPDPLPNDLHLIMTQGGDDRVCPPEPNHIFFKKLPLPDKTWQVFPGLLHECCRKPQVLDLVTEWFQKEMLIFLKK
jgi:acylglycerol lipase